MQQVDIERRIKARERLADARRRKYEAELREVGVEEGGAGGLIEQSELQAASDLTL